VAGPREWYEEIASTQDRAIALARAGAEEGTRVVAARQTAGRGRLDHRWESPGGGLHLSIVLDAANDGSGLLPLALGGVLAERFARMTGRPIVLKWPNDVLLVDVGRPSRKLAGILVDRISIARRGTVAIAGIGVNVRVDPTQYPAELRPRIVGLADLLAVPPALERVEEIVAEEALRAADEMRSRGGRDRMLALCRRLLWGVGRRATLDGRPVGIIRRLGAEGELRTEVAGEEVAIRAGDLRVDESG
jgi:BirA family transcriptional regulator, biotin operon repressor / biotin---[acetyl-CoA-carboxylase] ligase